MKVIPQREGRTWVPDMGVTFFADKLKSYFSRYGDISDVVRAAIRLAIGRVMMRIPQVVMRDRNSRLPRGFGFVTFKDTEAAASACKEPHRIDGRTVSAATGAGTESL